MGLRIGARRSDLARLQAYQVGQALEKNDHSIDYIFRQSLGDINQEDPLWKMPEKGVFTEDFRQGLLAGQFDMVVHSWKDLPTDWPETTEVVATLPRADARDLFLFKKSSWSEVKSSGHLKIFSSSPRRVHNSGPFIKEHFPTALQNVSFLDVRGNILTRVKKLIESDEVHGLIVAKAALDRLLSVEGEEFEPGKKELQTFIEQCRWQILPLAVNPTAAAQGALAVEIPAGREDLKEALAEIHCQKTWDDVVEERKILRSYGGGCHQKIGVSLATHGFGRLRAVRGLTDAGEILSRNEFEGWPHNLNKPHSDPIKLFERKPISYQRPQAIKNHLVARSEALPDDESFSEDEILWVSGIKSWKKLAGRGYWVNGCSEGLGEMHSQSLQVLVGSGPWLKWTHDQGAKSGDSTQILATYHLQPLATPAMDFVQCDELYWMSGSQFQRAVALAPQVAQKRHFCGPGHTFTLIQQMLKDRGIEKAPTILPGYEFWTQAVKR